MFSNHPHNERPSLLTLANRVITSNSGKNSDRNVVGLNNGVSAADDSGQSIFAGRSSAGNGTWQALRERLKFANTSPGHEEAVASIEQDIGTLVAHEAAGHHNYSYMDQDAFRPLINPMIIARAIWRWRWPIIATTFLGGVAGVIIALNTPHIYTASSQVLIDPRQVKLVDRDLTPEFLGTESALAIVDSQLESVYSTPVLARVVNDLNLTQVSEFNGTDDDGFGLLNGIAFVRSLFSAETPVDTSERVTVENLREAISAKRTSSTFVFKIYADSHNPRLAAQIANSVTQSFIENQIERESLAARTASAALGNQMVKLQAAVENAERKAELYAQANNLARVEGLTLTDNQLVATSAQLSDAKAATIRAKSIAEAAKSANVDAVVSGALPPELVTSALTTFRSQFSSLSQNAAALEQALGPRHPRLATAVAARESARSEIAAELQRIIAGTQADLRRAIQNEQQIAASLAETRAEQGQSGEALIRLRELEAEIEAAQSIYKAALLRSQETSQLENLASVNATIISEAEPPLYASSISRKFIAASGAFTGFALGIGLAFIAGLRDCVQANKNATRQNPSPSGGRYGPVQRQSYDRGVAPQPTHGFAPQPASYGATGMRVDAPTNYQPDTQFAQQQMQSQPVTHRHQDASGSSHDAEMEMEELRASVQDIREVLDHLMQTRSTRQRYG